MDLPTTCPAVSHEDGYGVQLAIVDCDGAEQLHWPGEGGAGFVAYKDCLRGDRQGVAWLNIGLIIWLGCWWEL